MTHRVLVTDKLVTKKTWKKIKGYRLTRRCSKGLPLSTVNCGTRRKQVA